MANLPSKRRSPKILFKSFLVLAYSGLGLVLATALPFIPALNVPTDIQQPGTQPLEVVQLNKPDDCGGCHGDYDQAVEPYRNWQGSMMAHAGRDPLFWACLAIAEQDFDGSGDLCIRCHFPAGWLDDRSTPTDGSALKDEDAEGITCHLCHLQTNPDESEFIGVQNPPFEAHSGGAKPTGYYGSGMYVVGGFPDLRYGPYLSHTAPHPAAKADFIRQPESCGTCHDVSNPLTGDVAHNNGAMQPLSPGTFSGQLGGSVTGKAAFNNEPFLYGMMERTFSEHKSSALSTFRVSDYLTLPQDLQAGVLESTYQASLVAGNGGDYEDGDTRYFTCQSCHLPPVTGHGCKDPSPNRKDLPLHDLTGGNYWAPQAIQYLDNQGLVSPGGGLDSDTIAAMNRGIARAKANLRQASTLSVTGDTVKVTNLTGHKLPSGYPEGRRMWLNIKWYDAGGGFLREDGEYGAMSVTVNGQQVSVDTILDLNGANTKIYEAHMAMTQEWANQLLGMGYSPNKVLSYDRMTGQPDYTLGDLAGQAVGTNYNTFHFVLNNTISKDNRTPPYGYRYDDAKTRNALPVPEAQYGSPGAGGIYRYWDEVALNPPNGAVRADVDLMYQPTSWEYVQFLLLANDGSVAFLQDRGQQLYDAWRNTGMAAPEVMASAEWTGSGSSGPTLSVSGLVAGGTAQLTVDNATPSGLVGFAYSLSGGGPATLPAGSCGLLTVDLSNPVQVIGIQPANGLGSSTLSVPIPSGATGVSVWFQALDVVSCELTNGLAEIIG